MNKIKNTGVVIFLTYMASFSTQAAECKPNRSTEDFLKSDLIQNGREIICGKDVVQGLTEGGVTSYTTFSVDGKEFYRERTGITVTDKVLEDFYRGLGSAGSDQGVMTADGRYPSKELITRHTTNAIAQRLNNSIPLFFSKGARRGSRAASSDSSVQELAFWGLTNISQISEDDGEKDHIDNDIYQFIGGVDKAFGNLFIGSTLTYAYAENEQLGADSISNTVGITPYLAYKLNDFMFVSGLAGYNYTGVISPGPDTDVHEYYTEANVTAFKEINSFTLTGRAGVRYSHTFASIKTGLDNSSDELTWIGDLEVKYRFDNGLTTYTGVLYEHYDREAFNGTTSVHDGIFFMRWGADYRIAEKLTVGATFETDLNDSVTSLVSGGVNIRLEI